MLCPECLSPLNHKIHKVFQCWECPEGHGTLYPKGELEKIVAAISGLGDLELRIWNDHDRYSVIESPLVCPEGARQLMEIRDEDYINIMIYGDPVSQSLWVHTGEEEKLVEHLQREAKTDSVASYLRLAAVESAKIFDDNTPLGEAAGHTLTALKLLGERILRAFPFLSI